MADEIRRQEYMRGQARELALQSVSPPPPPPPVAPIGPPPPPPPVVPADKAAAAREIAAAELMGPLGKSVFGKRSTPVAAADAPPAPPPPAGAPAEAPGPVGLNQEGDAVPSIPQAAPPRMVTPGGMYPDSMAATVHQGKPVPQSAKEANDQSTASRLSGAQEERDAEKKYWAGVANAHAGRDQAYADAAVAKARIQAERQAVIQRKLAEVDALNKEASAAIDPDKAWGDLGGRLIGALAMGFGAFGAALTGTQNWGQQAVMATVNARIEAMKSNRASKRDQAHQALNLVDVYRQKFGDDEKTVDEGLRLYLLKNVDSQIDKMAAQRGLDKADATYQKMKGDIAAEYANTENRMALQETDDVTKQATQKWHNPTYTGGGAVGAPGSKDESVIKVPGFTDSEKSTFVKVPRDVRADLDKQWGTAQQYARMNNEALSLRARIREIGVPTSGDQLEEHSRIMSDLKQLNADQATLRARIKDPATGVRESEVTREISQGVDYTAGLLPGSKLVRGDVDERIGDATNRVFSGADAMTRGVVGEVVQPVKVQMPDGSWDVRYRGQGKLYTGRSAPVVGTKSK
jgi:hypothetical protein